MSSKSLILNDLSVITQFLDSRKFQVHVEDFLSTSHIQENDAPQESVISPTLFITAISELTKLIKPPVEHLIYADDLTIYMTAHNIGTLIKTLQTSINKTQK